jgi:hypothetical protein
MLLKIRLTNINKKYHNGHIFYEIEKEKINFQEINAK